MLGWQQAIAAAGTPKPAKAGETLSNKGYLELEEKEKLLRRLFLASKQCWRSGPSRSRAAEAAAQQATRP